MQWLNDLPFADNRVLQIGFLAACGIAALMVLAILYRLVFARRLRVPGGRTRQPRLGLVDAFSLDGQRQLVLVRRDNIEHLVMIGGPNDVLIEPQINRAMAPARENNQASPLLAPGAPGGEPKRLARRAGRGRRPPTKAPPRPRRPRQRPPKAPPPVSAPAAKAPAAPAPASRAPRRRPRRRDRAGARRRPRPQPPAPAKPIEPSRRRAPLRSRPPPHNRRSPLARRRRVRRRRRVPRRRVRRCLRRLSRRADPAIGRPSPA